MGDYAGNAGIDTTGYNGWGMLGNGLEITGRGFNEVGRRALLTLLDQLESGKRDGTRETIAPELIVRASAAAPQP